MTKKILLAFLVFSGRLNAQEVPQTGEAQDTINMVDNSDTQTAKHRATDQVYHMKYQTVAPFIGVSFVAIAYSFNVIYKKSPTPVATIQNLNKNNIPVFDRWATQFHNLNMDKISYYPFYGVMPLPLILLADKKIRKDAGKIGVMYLEAFAFTGIIYGAAPYFVDRFRPDVYNTTLSMSYRTEGNYRNSFFAGHVAVVSTSTFFIAKVYADYNPESNWRWVIYTGAAAATVGMGYMRLEAGKHFPSDILLGALVGTASGILTPTMHKNKEKKQKWSLGPDIMSTGAGFAFTYKL